MLKSPVSGRELSKMDRGRGKRPPSLFVVRAPGRCAVVSRRLERPRLGKSKTRVRQAGKANGGFQTLCSFETVVIRTASGRKKTRARLGLACRAGLADRVRAFELVLFLNQGRRRQRTKQQSGDPPASHCYSMAWPSHFPARPAPSKARVWASITAVFWHAGTAR